MEPSFEENVTFPSQNNNGQCSGVLIGASNVSSGGVILLHDWWGLTRGIREIAVRISEESGLMMLVPDLYRGKIAEDREKVEQFKESLNWTDTLADIRAAAEFLQIKGCTKVGVVGKCMGGALALAAAVKLEDVITAAVTFYGIPDQIVYDCKEIKIPLQLHFAAHDKERFSCKKGYEPLKDSLVVKDVNMEFYEYDAEHDFANPSQPNFLRGACTLSVNRCCEFLKQHLS